ncbi:hypothetical protein ACK3TF_002126 [Chlorella vulgaris]
MSAMIGQHVRCTPANTLATRSVWPHAASERPTRSRLWLAAAGGNSASSNGEGEGSPLPPPPPPLNPVLSQRSVLISSSAQHSVGLTSTRASNGREADKWAAQYQLQSSSDVGDASSSASSSSNSSGSDSTDASSSGRKEFLLPVMTLSKVKLPTESISLQIFEPRYRMLFKLVNKSTSRRFGVVLSDKSTGMMESVGALCEMTHFITVPERRRLFINARVVGRFSTRHVVSDKPFVAVQAVEHKDERPAELTEQLLAAAQEQRVWETMQEIKELAAKLFVRGQKLGNDIFSLEARRWSPDAAARKAVPTAAGADPTLLALVQAAGLLGDEQTMAERTTEYVCSDALRQVSEDERRERFSFALARKLDLGQEELQQLMYSQDTSERLRVVEEHMIKGRAYLAARSTLRDMF